MYKSNKSLKLGLKINIETKAEYRIKVNLTVKGQWG